MEKKLSPRTAWDYLALIKERGIDPNFWTSYDYLLWSGARVVADDNWIWPEADGFCLLPPVPLSYTFPWVPPSFGDKIIWTDYLEHFGMVQRVNMLDWEYLYNPSNFLDMEGKNWKTFRKNVKKYPNSTRLPISYQRIKSHNVDETLRLLNEWCEDKGGAEAIQDLDTIINYIEKSPLKFGLYEGTRLIGFNIWDHNWKYINFRYSFYNPEIPFLSEYLRFRFYTDPRITKYRKLVNDGGTLDNPGLEFFKDRLQPVRKRKVYSWRIRQDENQNGGVEANI